MSGSILVTDRVDSDTQPHQTFHRRALLIGIRYKDTEGYGQLSEPHNDVDKFLKLLIDVYGYRKEDITVMKDDAGCVEERLQPMESNIRRELKALVQGAIPEDRLTLLFCGHSCQEAATLEDHHEEDGYDEAIVTMDNKEILDNDLKKILVSPLPSGATLTAIFDCCHAGTLLDLPHYHCNAVYVPWISKGKRRTRTLMNRNIAALRFPLAMTLPDRRNVTSPHHGHYPAGTDYPSSHENRLLSQALSPTETFLCDYLSQFKGRIQPTYEELMIHINYKLYEVGQKLHDETRNYKSKQPMGSTDGSNEEPWEGELNNFQSPYLSSLSPLDMHDKFEL
ncbi:uncharacterized protein STEHIDRAFT_155021 [Stereum hirsutum FP-91666 SS1]|uniref:uncharacterized protein n=1 Tax=Stereum hirsutum (strain FP-91666) TaxID=721885 RepID=UPI000440C6B5|nr:uncharacterized protein STEHIDRAFT_155021 [Stereum hirsutum FP-91666 SS1]EIM89345.1 hypothetical protein STEHIDRAFT_155021 [Stereum hirsutum FP-91666 SS1]